MAYRYNWHW